MVMIGFIAAFVYAVVGVLTYKNVISKWDNTKFEKVWFSCVWVALIPLYIVHFLHNKK